MTGPTPYRPPELTPTRRVYGVPVADKAKPWLALRAGETERQWHARMSHTCWRCGHYDEDNEALDRHEAEHGG